MTCFCSIVLALPLPYRHKATLGEAASSSLVHTRVSVFAAASTTRCEEAAATRGTRSTKSCAHRTVLCSKYACATASISRVRSDGPHLCLVPSANVTRRLARRREAQLSARAQEATGADAPAAAADIGPADIGPADIGPAHIGPADIGPADIGPADIGPWCRRSSAVSSSFDVHAAISSTRNKRLQCEPSRSVDVAHSSRLLLFLSFLQPRIRRRLLPSRCRNTKHSCVQHPVCGSTRGCTCDPLRTQRCVSRCRTAGKNGRGTHQRRAAGCVLRGGARGAARRVLRTELRAGASTGTRAVALAGSCWSVSWATRCVSSLPMQSNQQLLQFAQHSTLCMKSESEGFTPKMTRS